MNNVSSNTNLQCSLSADIIDFQSPGLSNVLPNEFHLSNVSKDTTRQMIIDYMKIKGVADMTHVKLTCLVPPSRDRSTLSYLSYKIDTNDAISNIIQAVDFWPPKTRFRRFVQKNSRTATFSTQNAENFHTPRHQIYFMKTSTAYLVIKFLIYCCHLRRLIITL